jgi:spoIIIJ-associated protein
VTEPSSRRFFSGETETQAVIEAAGHFGLSPAELAYRPVEKKHGFLRRPRVVIEVDPTQPRREKASAVPKAAPVVGDRPGRPSGSTPTAPTESAGSSNPAPRHDAPEGAALAADVPWVVAATGSGRLSGREGAVAAAEAVVALASLRLEPMAEILEGVDGDEIRVDLRGADRAELTSRQGELLRSCEYLVRRMVRDLPAGGLVVDSEGFRAEREESLRRRAAAAAEEVRRSGEPVLFEPLPAAERRIVHLAVQGEPAVVSESEGDGDFRRVRVFRLAGDATTPEA